MTAPSLADFAPGEAWSVAAGDACHTLRLNSAEQLVDTGREGGEFRLEFLGPAEPLLEQAIYRFERDGAAHEIFIVPIARDAEGIRYEAIFA